jgi:CheY-like chemotaxis protein
MRKTRVLIVDDEPDIADTLAMVLRQSGHETATAENGAAALERLRNGFDASVVLLDLMMPVMDGESFLNEQRRDPVLAHSRARIRGEKAIAAGRVGIALRLRRRPESSRP